MKVNLDPKKIFDSVGYPQIHYTSYDKKKALWRKYKSGLIIECDYNYGKLFVIRNVSFKQRCKCKIGKHTPLPVDLFYNSMYGIGYNAICVHCRKYYEGWHYWP